MSSIQLISCIYNTYITLQWHSHTRKNGKDSKSKVRTEAHRLPKHNMEAMDTNQKGEGV